MNNPSEPDNTREPTPIQPGPTPIPADQANWDEPVAPKEESAPYGSAQAIDPPYTEALSTSHPYPAATPPRKGRSKLFYIVAGVIATVLVLGLLCGAALGFGVFHAWQTSSAVSPVLEQTMQAMQAKDVDKALALFAPPIQGDELRANLQQMIDTPEYYAYFEGYERLSVDGVNAGVNAGATTEHPPGEWADVTADVTYQDGTHRTLTATLNKLEGQWKMLSIQISNPTTPDATPEATPETPAGEGA